ncbi:MAG: hypothetical protein K2L07_01150 [Lachnospiraceae bacterium]|nr:hypothetical protein [Lachnospiraceae bacterium]
MKEMEPADRTEIFLDRIKAMNKRSYRFICIGAAFTICFLEFAFMWGDMWGIWENIWSKVGAVVFYIAVIWNLAWVYGAFFFAQYILPPGRDGKTAQSLVPHYVNLPLDVERMLSILKKGFGEASGILSRHPFSYLRQSFFLNFQKWMEKPGLYRQSPQRAGFSGL